MSLFERSGFERTLMQLPGVSFAEARVAKVGGKVFCLLSDRQPLRIVFKCGEASFDILTALEGIGQPPYFAKRHWVEVQQGAPLSEEELRAYIGRSHALVATRLTRKLRTELGIG